MASNVEVNALNVLPVAPRFQYLPISTPGVGGPAAASGAGRLRAGGGLSGMARVRGGNIVN